MLNTVISPDKSSDRWSQMDPTGEVYLADPVMVEKAIKAILDPLYGENYDSALLTTAIEDLVQAYRGNYPGLLRCDTLYHDLRHALETGLTTARLLDGHAKSLTPGHEEEYIDGNHALLAVLLALFHDIGLQRRKSEAHLWGPVLTPIHEERGVKFMQRYLSKTTLAPFAEKSVLIMATKLIFKMPDTWSTFDRRLAGIVASADLLSQLSDRCYLEKCRDFLFVEFSALGLAGKVDSPYPDRETLLAKTPDFFAGIIRQRLEEEFQGVHRLIEVHTGGINPWADSIKRNLIFLEDTLSSRNFARLQRHPITFI
jgi:hypothetical protein